MRLIDRDAITNKDICEYLGRDYTSCAPDIEDLLDEQPTVEAEPVRHGRWIEASNELNKYCSECGAIFGDIYSKTPYCPYCGAKMDGKENG